MTAFKQPKFGTAAATHFAALLQRFLKPFCSTAAALPISYGLLCKYWVVLSNGKFFFLPQLPLISQSGWLICCCQWESRQHCLRQCVTHSGNNIFFVVDIAGKNNPFSAVCTLVDDMHHYSSQNLLSTHIQVKAQPQTFDHCDDACCCRQEYRPC